MHCRLKQSIFVVSGVRVLAEVYLTLEVREHPDGNSLAGKTVYIPYPGQPLGPVRAGVSPSTGASAYHSHHLRSLLLMRTTTTPSPASPKEPNYYLVVVCIR